MSKRLEELGAEVARIQDEELRDGRRRAAVRRRLLTEEREAPREGAPRWAPVIAWAGAMAVIALGAVALWPDVAEPVAYRVEGGEESRRVDRAIEAPSDQPLSIAFTDGSAVRLDPSARAHVSQLTTDGATLTLDRGEATVSVRHRSATQWSVAAGPFVVRVTGTRFRVGWKPEQQAFDLRVFEGEVRVRGPSKSERILRDGQEMHETLAAPPLPEPPPPVEEPAPDIAPKPQRTIEAPRREVTEPTPPRLVPSRPLPPQPVPSRPAPSREPSTAAPSSYRPPAAPLELDLPPKETSTPSATTGAKSEAVTRPETPPAAERTAETNEGQATEPAPEASAEAAPPMPAWKKLVDQGKHAELLTELSPSEVEQALWQAAPTELIDLGAAARQLRDTRAGYIYSVVRSRFPSTDAAADAAFVLGRMQFHSGAYRGSATWFETYLRERPDGRFAREAAGRLIEAYQQSEDEDRAREAAREYLRRYPEGPHSALARTVLQ